MLTINTSTTQQGHTEDPTPEKMLISPSNNISERDPAGTFLAVGTRTKMWSALKWPASSCSGKPPSDGLGDQRERGINGLVVDRLNLLERWRAGR